MKQIIEKAKQYFQKKAPPPPKQKPPPKQTKIEEPIAKPPDQKVATMNPKAKQQAVQEGSKLLKKGLKVDPQFAGNQKPKPDTGDPYKSREIAKEKTPPYNPTPPMNTPQVKSKSKGRSL